MTMNRPTAAALTLASTLLFASAPVLAHGNSAHHVHAQLEQEKQDTQIYRAHFPTPALGRKAAISFHDKLLQSNYAQGYLVLELDAADMDKLRAFGFRFSPATDYIRQRDAFLTQMQMAQSRRLSSANATGAAGQALESANVQSIPNFACYETVEETAAQAEAFVSSKPNLASLVDAGDSWEKTQGLGGYDIRVLKLTNAAIGGNKPKLFVNAAIHAREYTTTPLVLEFARWLVNGHGVDADATWILDHHEVHLMLHTNPDGRKRAETGLSWRKNTNNNFCANTNTRGIDLNRNFSFTWNSTAGQGSSGNACNLTFRGPSPGSEPETQAVQNYVRSLWPDRRGPNPTDAAPADTSGIHLDIHSFSQLVLWPWGTTATPAPNGTALQTLGRKFAFFNNYTPQQSIGLYPTDGTSDAVSYGELGVAAFTFELGTSFFESCTTYNNVIKPGNLPALIYAAKVVRTPYITPGGPDITGLGLSANASAGGVLAGTVVTLNASATDTRFNNSNGVEPTQAIAGARYTVNIPPWDPAAVPVALAPADGSFNSSTEALLGSINTSGLPRGRHLVYVQARDAGGTWGAVSAVFLNVVDTLPPPVPAFSANCTNLSCSFNAAATTGATTYAWALGDGSTATGVAVNKAYAAAGTYTVTLTAGNGVVSASQSQAVTVTARPAVVTVAEIENNGSLNSAQVINPNPAVVNGSISSTRDQDFYRVSLGAGRTLRATLTPNSQSNYNLYIYNAAGSLLASSTQGTGRVDSASASNRGTAAATVYVRVLYSSGRTGTTAGSYTLGLQQ